VLHISVFITVYILVIAFVLGAVFGSFLNCMAWRIAHNESVLHGRSHCPTCNHLLGAGDLVPIFSYIFLGGKCRYCGTKISPRYFLTELLMAMAFVAVVVRYDVTFDALRYLVLICILLTLSLVDLEIYEIPDRFHIAGIVWWAVTIPLTAEPWKLQLEKGLIGAFVIAGAMLLLAVIFDKVTGKESLGGGDVKLFFMTGLYLGPWIGLFNLIVACIIGIIFVVVMKQRKIPFGPAISIAVFISILVGNNVISWYLSLL